MVQVFQKGKQLHYIYAHLLEYTEEKQTGRDQQSKKTHII